MRKREFFKTSVLAATGMVLYPSESFGCTPVKNKCGFYAPRLTYSFNSVRSLYPEELLRNNYSSSVINKSRLLNNRIIKKNYKFCGGRQIFREAHLLDKNFLQNFITYYNNRLFFKSLSPNNNKFPEGALGNKIIHDFGSFEKLVLKTTDAANKLKDDGWVWIIYRKGNLEVLSTLSNENPLMKSIPLSHQGFPVVGIGIWRNSYRNKNISDNSSIIKAFWEMANWNYLNKRYNRAIDSTS